MCNEENFDVKRERGRPKGSRDSFPRKKRTDFPPAVEQGENSKLVAFNMSLMRKPKVDTNNRKEVEDRVYWYFDQCIKNDIRPGVAGLCLALGISRIAFYRWGAENTHGYSDIVAQAKAAMEAVLEQLVLSNKLNPVSAIFQLKNHFNYRDQSDHVFTTEVRSPMGIPTDSETLRRRYLEQKVPDDWDDAADDDAVSDGE